MTTKIFEKSSFWKWFFVTGIIPAFLLIICWNIIARDQVDSIKRLAIQESRREIRGIRRDGSDENYLQHRLNGLYTLLSEEGFRSEKIAGIVSEWREASLDFVNLKFFSPDGSHLRVIGLDDKDRVVTGKVFQALISAEISGSDKLLIQNRAFLENFAGGILPSELVAQKSALVKVTRAGSPGYLYWNSFYDHGESGRLLGGMLAFFATADVPDLIGVKTLIRARNAAQKSRFGFVGAGQNSAELMPKIVSMQRSFLNESEEYGKILLIEPYDHGTVLYCLAEIDDYRWKRFDILIKIMALILLVAAGRFSFDFSGMTTELKRQSLGRLAALAGLLPLLVIFSTGYAYIQIKKQQSISNIRENLDELVESVDESYELAVRNLGLVYDEICQHESLVNFNRENLNSLATYLSEKDAVQRIFMVDSEGEILFGWPSGVDNDVVKKLLPAVARRIYQMHLGFEPSLKNKLNDMMVDKMTEGFSEILGDVKAGLYRNFENLNRVNEIWLGKNRYYIYAGFVHSSEKNKPELLLLWHKTDSFARRYLIRQVRRSITSSDKERSASLAMMSRREDEMPFPPELTKYSFSRSLSERVKKTGNRQFSIEEKAGEKWLVLAHPMMRVPDSILFAMYPLGPMQKEIDLMVLLLVLVVISTGYFVRQFVKM